MYTVAHQTEPNDETMTYFHGFNLFTVMMTYDVTRNDIKNSGRVNAVAVYHI